MNENYHGKNSNIADLAIGRKKEMPPLNSFIVSSVMVPSLLAGPTLKRCGFIPMTRFGASLQSSMK
jgi:hypothetical protein